MNNEKIHKIMDLCLEAKKHGHDCFLNYSSHVDKLEFHVHIFGWSTHTEPAYRNDIHLNYPNVDEEFDNVIAFLQDVINNDDKTVKLNNFKRIFNSIDKWKDKNIEDYELSNLMTKIEIAFSIPACNDEAFNTENADVMELYRKVSNERSFIKALKA